MADQLATTAQVKTRLGITDAVDDSLISELLDQVSDYCQNFTGRKLVPVASTTYVFDTTYGPTLRLGALGIRSVTSMGVAQTHQPDSAGTYISVPTADILLRPKAQDATNGWPYQEVWLSRGILSGTTRNFADAQNGCTITGTFGFAVTPPEIVSVTIDAVVAAYQARKNGASGVMGSEDGALVPWSNFFGKGSSQYWTLSRYRYVGIG